MLDKIKAIVNSWWFEMATTGGAGVALWMYGHRMYAGFALGWAACKLFSYLRS